MAAEREPDEPDAAEMPVTFCMGMLRLFEVIVPESVIEPGNLALGRVPLLILFALVVSVEQEGAEFDKSPHAG